MSAGYVAAGSARLAYGVVVTALPLGVAFAARRNPLLRTHWQIPLAFFGLALFIFTDRYIPRLVATYLLGDGPVAGNPYASTITGTVVIQIVELLLTIVAVLVTVCLSGSPLSSIYLTRGRFGRGYAIALIGIVALYVLTFRALSHSSFIPVKGSFDFARYLSLTPAMLTMVAANGFLEELMFRGLLMSSLNLAFGPLVSTLVQALIFASWHVGVTYTSSAVVLIGLFVFPLGILAAYLTRSSSSILPSSILHAGVDMPVYLAFLSYVS